MCVTFTELYIKLDRNPKIFDVQKYNCVILCRLGRYGFRYTYGQKHQQLKHYLTPDPRINYLFISCYWP